MVSLKKGTNNEDVSNMNQIFIVQYLQRHGVSTRAQISKAMGLTQASVSKITGRLIEMGIVEETGFLTGAKGRRSVGIYLCANQRKVIGVKLSRRTFTVGCFNMSGKCLGSHAEQFSEKELLPEIFKRIKALIHQYLKQYPDVCAIGVAVPGPFLKDDGTILLITAMGGTKAENVCISKEFDSRQFGDIPVIIRHDANSGALADWWFNTTKTRLHGSLIHFLVGEGVGAGIVNDGVILEGSHGTAGEIGHMSVDVNGPRCHCGNYGCLEQYCSSVAFVQYALEHLSEWPESALCRRSPLTASDIFQAAKAGDVYAASLVERAGKFIGYGLVNLINAYDPDTILISNDMAEGGELLLTAARAVVRERMLEGVWKHVKIEISNFQHDPVFYGAAAVAIDHCLRHPELLAKEPSEKSGESAAMHLTI